MKSREKNLYFCAFFGLLLLVLGGLELVDTNLNRLILPQAPIATLSLGYEHGLALTGATRDYRLPCLELVTLRVEGEDLFLSRGEKSLKIPASLPLGQIEGLRRMLHIDKSLP